MKYCFGLAYRERPVLVTLHVFLLSVPQISMSVYIMKLIHVDRTVIVQTQPAVTIVSARQDTHLHKIECIASVSDSALDNLCFTFM